MSHKLVKAQQQQMLSVPAPRHGRKASSGSLNTRAALDAFGSGSAYLIDHKELQFGDVVGEGHYGKVFRGVLGDQDVAIKACYNRSDEDTMYTEREAQMLKSVRHPNIVQFIGVSQSENEFFILTEFVPGGTLRDALCKDRNKRLLWGQRVRWILDVALAIDYLHSRKLMHRDLKTENVLIDSNNRCKVVDLGYARGVSKRKISKRPLTMLGTDDWMPPEVILCMDYDELADVFSFGLIMAEVIVREPIGTVLKRQVPGFGIDADELMNLAPEGTPGMLLHLCTMCTEVEARHRPSMKEVINVLRDVMKQIPSEEMPKEKGAIRDLRDNRSGSPQQAYRRRADASMRQTLGGVTRTGPNAPSASAAPSRSASEPALVVLPPEAVSPAYRTIMKKAGLARVPSDPTFPETGSEKLSSGGRPSNASHRSRRSSNGGRSRRKREPVI